MGLIQKANKLGYKYCTEFTVEELDNLSLGNSNKQIEYFFIQKWLREVYGIHISIWFNTLTEKYRPESANGDLDELLDNFVTKNREFKTYEQALEEALQKALIIIKEKI